MLGNLPMFGVSQRKKVDMLKYQVFKSSNIFCLCWSLKHLTGWSYSEPFSPQVVTNRDTQETLLCIAFVFEVSTSEHGAQYHVYRLVKD